MHKVPNNTLQVTFDPLRTPAVARARIVSNAHERGRRASRPIGRRLKVGQGQSRTRNVVPAVMWRRGNCSLSPGKELS
jgi:hypothetical protein